MPPRKKTTNRNKKIKKGQPRKGRKTPLIIKKLKGYFKEFKKSYKKKTATYWTITGTVATIIIAIIGYLLSIPYSFIVTPNIIKTGDRVYIVADNWRTDKHVEIDVKFDGHIFKSAGKPLPKNEKARQKWTFDLKYQQRVTPRMVKTGEHDIAFAFSGKKFTSEQKITFFSASSPPTKVKVKKPARGIDISSLVFLVFLLLLIALAIGFMIFNVLNKRKSR